MSFLGNYGTTAEEVNENPFGVSKRDSYPVSISEAEVKTFKKDPDTEYFVITYEISDGPEEGKNASRMFRMKPLTAADQSDFASANARTTSNYKKALLELGLTPAQINAFDPNKHGDKLVGIKGTAVIGPQKDRPEYNTVFGFERNAPAIHVPEAVTPTVSEESVVDVLGDW